jgi:peptidoglycan/xylan/chitin deacetylase (PgdA/CDA1 family)
MRRDLALSREFVRGVAGLSSTLVLNFHLIGKPARALDDGERDVSLERAQFVEILEVVAGRDDVRLTFDDGNRSDISEALPELLERGLDAEFFICPSRFGTAEFLDEDGVRELRDAGMSVGSHGMDHVPWRRLGPAAIDREIVQAKRILQETLLAPVESAACPFGAYDRRTLVALRGARFTRVYTSDGGWTHAGQWLAARNTVHRWDTAESIARLLDSPETQVALGHRAKGLIKRWR